MSRENVEVVRAGLAAWNAGDMDALRELYHPDVIVRPLEGWPEPGPVAGREAVMRSWQGILDVFPEATLELTSVTNVGDRVVARQVAHGKGKGPEAIAEYTVISTLRNGRTLILEYFWDHAEALASLGLSE